MEFTDKGVLLESRMEFPIKMTKADIIGMQVADDSGYNICGKVVKADKLEGFMGKSDKPGMCMWRIVSEITDPMLVVIFKTIHGGTPKNLGSKYSSKVKKVAKTTAKPKAKKVIKTKGIVKKGEIKKKWQ